MDVNIKLQQPHEGQSEILNNRKRYNHIRCGRRWGKTSMIQYLTLPALKGAWIGIWFPTYKDLHKVWENLKYIYYKVTIRSQETLKRIDLVNGGEIEFWSMEDPDSGRGFEYDRAIVDEAAKAKKFNQAWNETIRGTLANRRGDAFIFSTPKGKTNYFYNLEMETREFDNWAFFHFTSLSNPYFPEDEWEGLQNQLDEVTFDQEYKALYVDANEMPFLYEFHENRHVTDEVFEVNPHLDLWISFDFNVDPMSVTIGQQTDYRSFRFIDEIRLSNSGTYEMCQHIKSNYYNYDLIVTGDATGTRRTTAAGSLNDWKIIRQELELSDYQIKKRSKNLNLADSRTLCNSILRNGNVIISSKCKNLVEDFREARVDQDGKLIKDEATSGMHFLDTGRYMLDAVFPDFISNYHKYLDE